jgi:hypothetical protein
LGFLSNTIIREMGMNENSVEKKVFETHCSFAPNPLLKRHEKQIDQKQQLQVYYYLVPVLC